MINRGDSIEPEAPATYESTGHNLLVFYFRRSRRKCPWASQPPLLPPLPFLDLSIYLSTLPSIMDNKTFHALKSNNRTRVSQKIGWLAKEIRGFTFFPSLSLFLSPRTLYFYHPLGITSIERPTQKDSKRKTGKSPARRLRSEHVNGMGENESNTASFFWKQTSTGHRLNYRSNIPLQRRIPEEEFSSSEFREQVAGPLVRQNSMNPVISRGKSNEMGKWQGEQCHHALSFGSNFKWDFYSKSSFEVER